MADGAEVAWFWLYAIRGPRGSAGLFEDCRSVLRSCNLGGTLRLRVFGGASGFKASWISLTRRPMNLGLRCGPLSAQGFSAKALKVS